MSRDIPWIISMDDHVVEPPHVWQAWLPPKYRDRGPRIVHDTVGTQWGDGTQTIVKGGDGPEVQWWIYEDFAWTHQMLFSAAGYKQEEWWMGPIRYDQMRPGCYEVKSRLADMDLNHIEAAVCFPTYTRFCGQLFNERKDKELALACVRAYNDWMVEEWAGESGGRLIPLGLIPLWDAQLAADEVRRNAARGVHAVAFSELPGSLGLPTLHAKDRHWEPFLAACAETDTTIFMHIGSGSTFLTSSKDAPPVITASLVHLTANMALSDWLLSGALARHPNLNVCFAEGQLGWIPYLVQRMDVLWARDVWGDDQGRLPEPPSHYLKQVYGCFFDDLVGLQLRDQMGGIEQIVFETDYPHQDTTWPETVTTVKAFADLLTDDELEKVLRGNAIRLLQLDR